MIPALPPQRRSPFHEQGPRLLVTGAVLLLAAFVWPRSEGLSGAVVGAVVNHWLPGPLVPPSRRSTDGATVGPENVPDVNVSDGAPPSGEPEAAEGP